MDETKQLDTLKKFGNEYQIKAISACISSREYLEQIFDILEPKFWDVDAHQWIVSELKSYFVEYKNLPTPLSYKVKIDSIDSELLKKSIVDQLKLIYQKITDSDIKFVKETFLDFCKNQKLKSAILSSVDYVNSGKYDLIKHVVDDALKAGMERNLGHDYFNEFDKRMHDDARHCIKTGWEFIDKLLDGGLAKGELGFVIGPSGLGKCVGPNTEIEIQYYEIGIPTKCNSGKEYILWIKPFDKYEFDGKFLYGWQIEKIFVELEKIKKKCLAEERIQIK